MKIIPTLVCLFKEQDIKFKTFTIKALEKLSKQEQNIKVYNIYKDNIISLQKALDKCLELDINSYRVPSNLLPKYTYVVENKVLSNIQLQEITKRLKLINKDIILSTHPDQFVIMNSPKIDVVQNSVKELKYHLYLAKILNLDSINFHVGGKYNDKESAINRFIENMNNYFTKEELSYFTIENDEKSFNIDDVISICKKLDTRPTFDVHHEKCYLLKDVDWSYHKTELYFSEVLKECQKLWKNKGFKYMQCHLSSPRDDRYKTLKGSSPHSDYINKDDILDLSLLELDVVLDIEAKNKELAILDIKSLLN